MKRRTKSAEQTGATQDEASEFPGPSPNSTTNLLIADVLLSGASKLFRGSAKGQMLSTLINPKAAKRLLSGRTMGKSAVTYAATRLATRSIPGLLVVGGGLLAKTLFDRKMAKREALLQSEAKQSGVTQSETLKSESGSEIPGKNTPG